MPCYLKLNRNFNLADGPTDSADCFSGPLGKLFSGHKNRGLLGRERETVQYAPIPGLIGSIEIDPNWLSSTNQDTRTAITLSQLLNDGYSGPVRVVPGPAHNARWKTTASNLAYLITQEPEPSDQLILLVQIVQNLYVPMILQILSNRYLFTSVFIDLKKSRENEVGKNYKKYI